MDEIASLSGCVGFDWDKGNLEKNWLRHRVIPSECEQIFFNQPLIITGATKRSFEEKRLYALGQTDTGRRLFIVLTLRNNRIRIISARDMNKKERKEYETS